MLLLAYGILSPPARKLFRIRTYPACGRTRILGLSPSRTSPRMWQRTGVRSGFQKMSAARRTPTRGRRSSSCPPPTASSFSSSRTSCRPPSALTCLEKVRGDIHLLSSFYFLSREWSCGCMDHLSPDQQINYKKFLEPPEIRVFKTEFLTDGRGHLSTNQLINQTSDRFLRFMFWIYAWGTHWRLGSPLHQSTNQTINTLSHLRKSSMFLSSGLRFSLTAGVTSPSINQYNYW